MKIRNGDGILRTSDSWISRAIRKVTKSEWSHVGMFVDIDGTMFIIEMEAQGARLIKWSDYNKGKNVKVLHLVPTMRIDRTKLVVATIDEAGDTRYDFFGLFHQLIYQMTGVWIGKLRKKAAKRKYCSELFAYRYNEAVGIFPKWYSTSPQDVFNSEHFKHYKLTLHK